MAWTKRGNSLQRVKALTGVRGHVGLFPGGPAGVGHTSPHSPIPSPPEPPQPSLGPGPEAFGPLSRVPVWGPEPLPGQPLSCMREISVLL